MCNSNLLLWNERWKLLGGNAICRACGAVQQERDRAQPFVHANTCKRAADGAQPWPLLDNAIAEAQGGRGTLAERAGHLPGANHDVLVTLRHPMV